MKAVIRTLAREAAVAFVTSVATGGGAELMQRVMKAVDELRNPGATVSKKTKPKRPPKGYRR